MSKVTSTRLLKGQFFSIFRQKKWARWRTGTRWFISWSWWARLTDGRLQRTLHRFVFSVYSCRCFYTCFLPVSDTRSGVWSWRCDFYFLFTLQIQLRHVWWKTSKRTTYHLESSTLRERLLFFSEFLSLTLLFTVFQTVMSVLNDSLCVKLLAPLYNKEYYCNLGVSNNMFLIFNF